MRSLLAIGALWVVILYLKPMVDQFIPILSQFSWSSLIPIFILQGVFLVLMGHPFKRLTLRWDIQLTLRDWIRLGVVSNFLNHLLPWRPGLGYRYWLLSQYYQMTLKQFIWTHAWLLLYSVIISGSLLWVTWPREKLPLSLHQESLIWIAMGLIFLLVGMRAFQSSQAVPSQSTIRLKESLLVGLELIVLKGISAFIFLLCFSAFQIPLSFQYCVLFSGLLTLLSLFPLTPGNIGITESAIGFLSSFILEDFAYGFLAMALFRATQLSTSGVLSFAISGYTIANPLRKKGHQTGLF